MLVHTAHTQAIVKLNCYFLCTGFFVIPPPGRKARSDLRDASHSHMRNVDTKFAVSSAKFIDISAGLKREQTFTSSKSTLEDVRCRIC